MAPLAVPAGKRRQLQRLRGIAPARSFVLIEKEAMMRTTLTALALAAALLAACGYGQPGSPAPTVYGTQQPPSQGTVAPMPTY
jgi:hypothetical protein